MKTREQSRLLLKFYSFGGSHDLQQRHVERHRNPPHRPPRGVVSAGLDVRDPGWMQVGTEGHLLLAEAFSLPDMAKSQAEGRLRIGGARHAMKAKSHRALGSIDSDSREVRAMLVSSCNSIWRASLDEGTRCISEAALVENEDVVKDALRAAIEQVGGAEHG